MKIQDLKKGDKPNVITAKVRNNRKQYDFPVVDVIDQSETSSVYRCKYAKGMVAEGMVFLLPVTFNQEGNLQTIHHPHLASTDFN